MKSRFFKRNEINIYRGSGTIAYRIENEMINVRGILPEVTTTPFEM